MTRYSNFIKATSLSPDTAETLYKLIDSTPELKKLTGAQCAAVAALVFHQKVVSYDEGWGDSKSYFTNILNTL